MALPSSAQRLRIAQADNVHRVRRRRKRDADVVAAKSGDWSSQESAARAAMEESRREHGFN